MDRPFDYFVILSEMRTGSNFLESNLDQFPGLQCYGEAFNPWFMVSPDHVDLFGFTKDMRDADPLRLIEVLKKNTDGIPGFRLFHNHDQRVFDHVMADPRCAKVILNRNQVEAYVSKQIAWNTDQWQLSDHKDKVPNKMQFHPKDFKHRYHLLKDHQRTILRRLQTSGQAAFYIDYADLTDLSVVNGLAKFLGETTEIGNASGKFKKQNPEPLADKVINFEDVIRTVNEIDRYDLDAIPNFEPPRGASVPTFYTSLKTALCFMPIPGGLDTEIQDWIAAIDGDTRNALEHGVTQKELRQWKNRNKLHRSFTVLRHPVERAHAVFCHYVLNEGPLTMWDLRHGLIDNYDLPIPWDTPIGEGYDRVQHRQAFLVFLNFIAGTIGGSSAHGVEPIWATQDNLLRGFSQFVAPDHVFRESRIEEGLAVLGMELRFDPPALGPKLQDAPFQIADIYDEEVEKATRAAYTRDYMAFGFKRWDKEYEE